MNLATVFVNCLYLLGISIVVGIIVNIWLEMWFKIKLDYKLHRGAKMNKLKPKIIRLDDDEGLEELKRYIERSAQNESDSSGQEPPRD